MSLEDIKVVHTTNSCRLTKSYYHNGLVRQLVAVKRYKREEFDSVLESVVTEIGVIRRIKHKHLVSLLEVRQEHKLPVVIMEFGGKCLADVAYNAKFYERVRDARDLFCQILYGLHYLHKNGLIHRDVKSGNILMTNKGIIKLCDFGMTRPIGDEVNYISYTSHYRPIEVFRGDGEYAVSMDMWAFGCVMYEFLAGSDLLFDGDDDQKVVQSIMGEVPMTEEFFDELELDMGDTPLTGKWQKVDTIYTFNDVHKTSKGRWLNTLCKLNKKLLSPNPEDRPNTTKCIKTLKFSVPEHVEMLPRTFHCRRGMRLDLASRDTLVSEILAYHEHSFYRLPERATILAINILDRYLEHSRRKKIDGLIPYVVSAAILASKLENRSLYASNFESRFTKKEINQIVQELFKIINYDLDCRTVWDAGQEAGASWEKITELAQDYQSLVGKSYEEIVQLLK